MRAFWLYESNKSVGDLIEKLIEYWKEKCFIENCSITFQEEAILNSCIKIASRLKGSKVASIKATTNSGFQENKRKLLQRFDEFGKVMDSAGRRKRGNMLELLLQDAFNLYEITARNRFTRNDGGEQIDGAFTLDGWYYIVEFKWVEKLSDIRQLDSLYGKPNRSGKQTMGLFLSINGWSDNVVPLLKQNTDKSIILMDGYDLRCILDQTVGIALGKLLMDKLSHLNFDGEPFLSVAALINKKSC